MLMSEKMTLFIAIWTIAALFITGDGNLEIFLILVLVGLLISREFTDHFTTAKLRLRINIFILAFIIVFMTFVAKRVIDVWGI